MANPETEVRSSIRDRYRTQVQDEVKQAALTQLAEGGPAAVSVNAIAKQLGLSGPALYRYFPSRDALLTALTLDAYLDFAAALRTATSPDRAPSDPVERLRVLAAAYRGWARQQPHRYGLLFREAVPGYDAHATELVAAAQQVMAVNVEVIAAAAPVDLNAEFLGVVVWARFHGLVDLELNGNYASMGLDPELLYEFEIDQLIRAAARDGRG